jgi:hypothetical protein
MGTRLRCMGLLLLLPLSWLPLQGQIRGSIRDPSGAPLPDAVIELWAPAERLSITTSSVSGRFGFPKMPAAAGLWVRRIGYRPRRIELANPDSVLTLTLESQPISLAEVAAKAPPLCPHPEEAGARAVVVAMGRRYSQATDSIGLATYAWTSRGRVAAPGLSAFDTTNASLGQLGSAGLARRYLRRQIQFYGYALPASGGFGEATGAWEYVRLSSTFPQHFADSLFRDRHLFYALAEADGVRRVGFCPTQHRLPSIEGVLEIGPSGALLRATWVFHTPRPVEEAGGEVTLAPVVENGTPALMLPVAGLYWRRLGQRSYYQDWEKYTRWVVSPTDSIPRLLPPAR